MKIAIWLLVLVSSAYGYNILCLQSVPSRSHFILMMGLVNPLLEAGHQITLITTYPEIKQPKEVKVIDVSHTAAFNKILGQSDRSKHGISVLKEFARNISLGAIETPAVREVLVKEQFDAVITEWFFSEIEAGYAAIQQVPWIVLGGTLMHTNTEYLIDQVRTVPTIPTLKSQTSIPMNFFERLTNTKDYLFTMYLFWKYYPLLKSDYESQFYPLAQSRGVSLPPVISSMHNISVLLINSHPSFAPARSLPPNVVDIAGFHIDPKFPPLPKDLQDILDSSHHGVIYFSMGSVFNTSELPEYTNQNILKVFKELEKYTVLWKYDGKFDNLPKNVHIRPWLPQCSILAHPNVKIFITQGGLLSIVESLQFGIPLITIPVFGDQPNNAKRSENAGHALVVKFSPNMDSDLKEKLNIMLNNDSYYNKAKYISKLFNKRPVSSKTLIQHYVELAIETNGAYHLRSKSHLYAWYELWMLDQLAFVLLIIYIIYAIIKKLLYLILSLSSSSPKKIGKDKKTKTK